MEKIIHNVAEIDSADRRALEHLIGKHLTDYQQVIISVLELPAAATRPAQALEDWTSVYDGLSAEDIAAVDAVAKTRANLTRHLP